MYRYYSIIPYIYCKCMLLNRCIVHVYIILALTTTHTRNVPTLLAERGFATRPHDRDLNLTRELFVAYILYNIIITIIIIRVVSFFKNFLSVTRKGHDFRSAVDMGWWCKSVLGAVARTTTTDRL